MRALAALCLGGLVSAQQPTIGDRPDGASRSSVFARHGMACTSQPLATRVAVDILRRGGSAVDAAIAANAALGLMEPTGCGVGGDLFAMVWDPKARRLFGLNASGRAPRSQSLDELRAKAGGERLPDFGPLTVTVPGCVSGWAALHERFGALPWAELFAPAIDYAAEGFPLSAVIAGYWESNRRRLVEHAAELPALDGFERTYLVDGAAPRAGDVFRNPDLAATLRAIAEDGADTFYRGAIAERIAAYCARVGCPLTAADLAAHTADEVAPISTDYRGYRVWELPPNGQGLAALQMLNVLEAYDLRALGHNEVDYLHLHAEAKKLAFADRARFYADPAFADVPLAELLSKEYAAARRAAIDLERAALLDPPGDPAALRDGDTIYLTVADRDGMMVSLIQSNYMGMGSGLVPDGLGFMLQNRGSLFSLDPRHANAYAPGKRPFHTIIPAFVTRAGAPWLSFGVMGGAMQPQGHVQILCNLIDFGMGLQEAGDAPRYCHSGSSQPTGEAMTGGGTLHLESGIGSAVRAALAARGHRIATDGGYGGYQAIRWHADRGVYEGATELRKDGCALGY